MDRNLRDFCDRFIMNRDIMKIKYKWDGNDAAVLAAVEATARGREFDEESLDEAEALLKSKTGVFSDFRNTLRLYVIAKLATSRYPERLLDEAIEAQKMMKGSFSNGHYTALMALILPELCKDVEGAILSGKEIFRLMKKEHSFLTGSEDQIMAVLLACSGKREDKIIDDVEQCFAELKGHVKVSQDTRQMITEVLSLGDRDVRFNIVRFLRIQDELQGFGYKTPEDTKLTSFATLALSEIPIADALDTIRQIDNYLSKEKGYQGIFGYSKRERLAHAAVLTSAYYGGYDPDNTAIISLVISLIIATEQAAAAAAASASAATY